MIDGLRLPSHWRWAAFAHVAEVASDLVDPTLTPDAIHIAPNHIESWTGKLLPFATVAKDGITSAKHRFHVGQILYSKIRPYLAKAAIATFEGVCSADMYPVESSIDSKFLFHWLLSPWFTAQAARNQGRTILPKINQVAPGRLPVPVAPLSEQRRIVAKIEELFSDLDAGVAALERIRANLKRYRAAVLKAAVEGNLTKEWRAKHPKTEPASKLLERILAERRQKWEEDQLARFAADKTPPKGWREKFVEPAGPDTSTLSELPQNWCWATVEQITENHDGVRIPVKAKDREKKQGPHPYYGASGIIDHVDGFLFDGDYLLIAEDGANLLSRSTPIAFRASGQFWVNNHAHVVTTHGAIPLNYVELFFNATRFDFVITGTAQPKLTQAALNRIVLPIPSLPEQERIVAEVERLLSIVDESEAQVETNLKRAARLRQSILKRAFEGRLVPQDPTDEPADKLLDRIRQERTASNGGVAPRTRRGRASRQQPEAETDGAAS